LPFGYIFQSEKQIKTVITVSGSDVFPRKAYPTRFFLLSALRGSNAVISHSKWLARYLEENYQVHPVVIPNAVDTRIFRPHADSSTSNVVLFVGRFIKIKGILELLEAARELPQYEFWLAGRGPLKIPTLPNVKILGFHRNTAPLYAKANLCVFPSHYENFPMVGLEAMACGKALVATERGFSEYVENEKDGILIKPHDVGSLVNAVRYLMENEKTRKELERNARDKATQYDWTVIAEKYAKLYESL
jgi:glycosyltransferase involved in cell wall biosynthesis